MQHAWRDQKMTRKISVKGKSKFLPSEKKVEHFLGDSARDTTPHAE